MDKPVVGPSVEWASFNGAMAVRPWMDVLLAREASAVSASMGPWP